MNKILPLLFIAILTVSCASKEKKTEKNPFDAITLKEVLKEDKTSQAEIIKAFGAPDITTEDTSKQDVWVYSKHKNESSNNGFSTGGLAFLPGMFSVVGGMIDGGKAETSSNTVTLTLVFKKNKILKTYQLTKVRI